MGARVTQKRIVLVVAVDIMSSARGKVQVVVVVLPINHHATPFTVPHETS